MVSSHKRLKQEVRPTLRFLVAVFEIAVTAGGWHESASTWALNETCFTNIGESLRLLRYQNSPQDRLFVPVLAWTLNVWFGRRWWRRLRLLLYTVSVPWVRWDIEYHYSNHASLRVSLFYNLQNIHMSLLASLCEMYRNIETNWGRLLPLQER